MDCYLTGGRPAGATRDYPGCRDTTEPDERVPLELPGAVFFGWESPSWGGGVAFYDPDASGRALVTAYRLGADQLADIWAQEMHRQPGADLDLDLLLRRGSLVAGPGRYERLLVVDEFGSDPVVTFTFPRGHRPAENPPSPAYADTIVRGLVETHGLSEDVARTYVASLAPPPELYSLSKSVALLCCWARRRRVARTGSVSTVPTTT
nr:histone deacetylase [Flexivirga meconopsidis]